MDYVAREFLKDVESERKALNISSFELKPDFVGCYDLYIGEHSVLNEFELEKLMQTIPTHCGRYESLTDKIYARDVATFIDVLSFMSLVASVKNIKEWTDILSEEVKK